MKTSVRSISVRRIYWLLVLPVIMLLGSASLYAADENWPTREALGDMLVTQSGAVLVYGSDGTLKHTIPVAGENREVAFDTGLNAYVANVAPDGTGRIVKVPAASPHAAVLDAVQLASGLDLSTYNFATPIPRSLAFDRLQNLWVGLDNTKSMSGGRFVGVIQRYAKNTSGVYVLQQAISVPSDGGPISLDAYVTQAGTNGAPTVYYTSRGKIVRQLVGGVASTKWTLAGTGMAAQLRILHPPKGGGNEIGGVLVGYTTEYRFITAAGVQRICNFSDSVPIGQRQRTHVELDASPLFWWAGDAGSGEWRKLNFKTGCSAAPDTAAIATNLPSGGGATNGGLRVGPHLSFLTFPATSPGLKTTSKAGFLPDPTAKGGFAHSVTAMIDTPSAIKAAAWFVEVSSDGVCDTNGLTNSDDPYQLSDFDCRSVDHFTEQGSAIKVVHPAVQQTSRGREHYAWIHELTPKLDVQTSTAKINVSVFYKAKPAPSQTCPGGDLRATWFLDDPDPDLHQAAGGNTPVVFNQFDFNVLGGFFGDPTTSTGTKTTFNHYAVVRAPVQYAALIDPVINTQTLGSSLTLALTVRDAACRFKSGLASFLNLTVDKGGQPVADQFGYSGQTLSGTGVLPVTEQLSVERYKINLFLNPAIYKLDNNQPTTFLVCVNFDLNQDDAPALGLREHCTPVIMKAGGRR